MSLSTNRFANFEHKNTMWTATAEEGTTLEDVLKPSYFANVANRFNQYDRICVRVDTGDWYAELLVVSHGSNWAKTIPTFHEEFNESLNDEEGHNEAFEAFAVTFRGPHCKWSVIRKADKEVIKEQCNTKGEAQAWLASHMLSL